MDVLSDEFGDIILGVTCPLGTPCELCPMWCNNETGIFCPVLTLVSAFQKIKQSKRPN